MTGETDLIGRAIDQLLTIDYDQREVIDELYEAAYDHHGRSTNMLAAERLQEAVSPGDDVVIVTGFPIAPTFVQETDGPVGAASLARAVKVGLGAHPTILAEEQALAPIEAAARAYGLSVDDYSGDRRAPEADWTCTVESFTTDETEAEAAADALLDDLDPAALVAIERCSANEDGTYHMATGRDITDECIKSEPLFERTDALTVGVGDGGNELGMGVIRDRVEEVVPYGETVAAATETDVLVPVAISNHGGHGIAAALSVLLDENVLHSPEAEERALVESGLAGAIDGPIGRSDGWCDGLSPEAHASVVELLHATIEETGFGPEYREE